MEDAFDLTISRRSFAQAGGIALASLLLGASPFALGGCAATDGVRTGPLTHPASPAALTPELVARAVDILGPVALTTPLVSAPTLSGDVNVMLKLESLQKTGSFKLRGAYTMCALLSDEERAAGIVTCSAGNHAQGVAFAARAFGCPATIFIPADAPEEKIAATRSYGVDVQLVEGDFEQAKAEAEAFVEAGGGTYVPPYDDYRVMAGQGTMAAEMLAQCADIDAVVVPVGGGGLIAGIACALKAADPSIAVYGVEPEVIPSMSASLAAGAPVQVEALPTIADGIHVAKPGDKTFEVVQRLVDGVHTVTEEQIAQAIVHLATREKVVVEGAGAASVAAVMAGAIPLDEAKNVVCVVSGGNIDAADLGALLARA